MWLALEACKCRESCTVYVVQGKEYTLDVWLYIRVSYIIYYITFTKEYLNLCAWQRKEWWYFYFYSETAFFSFYQHSAAVPYCMIKENTESLLWIACQVTFLCENPYIRWQTLDCTWMFLTNVGLTHTQVRSSIWRKSFDVIQVCSEWRGSRGVVS